MKYQIDEISFGEWLKRRRKHADLTREALAQQIGCASVTIKRIETNTSRPSQQLAERILKHLDIPSTDWVPLLRAARTRVGPQGADRSCLSPGNIPRSVTSFVGRIHELQTLRRLLVRADIQLITLTGPGGTGKTRLAIQLATELRGAFADGVWFFSLAALTDPRQVLPLLARELGVAEDCESLLVARLASVLRTKQILLVLDNIERVIGVTPHLLTLLSAAPALTILVTSRMVLRVSGEHVFTVTPLPLPKCPHSLPLEALADSPAVALFTNRAQAVVADFALTATTAPVVAAICARLDGLPLAIELAVARLRLFTLPMLLARLDSCRLNVLGGGGHDLPARQRSMRASITWSYDLLDINVQAIFVQLSVFAGGFVLDAAEAVCAETAGMPVAEAIEQLLMQNLLQREDQGGSESRFTMLAVTQEFARERLAQSGRAAATWKCYAAYYLRLARQLAQERQASRPGGLPQEQANMRAAVSWMIEQGQAAHNDTAQAIAWFEQALAIHQASGAGCAEAELWDFGLALARQGHAGALPPLRAYVAYQAETGHADAVARAALLERLESGVDVARNGAGKRSH
jgi:predicted ATPase/DNA-binding XRE family transcriptional regulator